MDLAGPVPELQGGDDSNSTVRQLYLEDFTKLGGQIFYFEPNQQVEVSDSEDDVQSPDLTIVCSWLYALPKHISKYTSVYQRIYPSTPILLVAQDGPDLMWRPNAWQMENLKPALEVIRGLQEARGRRLRTLVHVFSNGGCFTACQLADAYALSARAENQHSGWLAGPVTKLPISALIIDSAPSIPDMRSGFVAMSQGLPSSLPGPVRLVSGALLYSFMATSSVVGKLFGVENVITSMRRKLNDAHGAFMANGVPRMYIYSESDELVPWEHVEMHAKEAKNVLDKRGRSPSDKWLKLEKFVGSRHVGHVMIDAERYWRIVKTHWAGAQTMT